jgi:hypothetical protein
VALSAATSERLQIEVLRLLKGVEWPVASVLLHWGHRDQYPVLDFRALWSLGIERNEIPPYDFDFWWDYVRYCRKVSDRTRICMRILDRALWQYSKEHQP